jgi:hypothetical protein
MSWDGSMSGRRHRRLAELRCLLSVTLGFLWGTTPWQLCYMTELEAQAVWRLGVCCLV